jgi:hypothetical protein
MSMTIESSPRRLSRVTWIVVAWLLTMTTGALTASLLRLPTAIPIGPPLMFLAHGVVAVAVGSAVIGHLVRAHRGGRILPALTVLATFVLGLLTIRSFAPVTSAAHAAVAAYAALALARTGSNTSSGAMSLEPGIRSWRAALATAAVLLLILQVGLGALVRHHLTGYGWHLLVAGLASLSVLVPAVAIGQDAGATPAAKRAASLAIAALLVQVSLGVVLLFLILTGSANVYVWLLTSVSHVVAGTIALLAAARFAWALRLRPTAQGIAPLPTTR